MQRLVLGTILIASACGPSDRTGDNQPDAKSWQDAPVVTEQDSRVYAHSGTKLYRIDTATLQPIEIGTMTGLGTQGLTDLAIDKSDRMFGVTLTKLFTINAQTGAATPVVSADLSAQGFTSLSFVPTDINNAASDDILVSANNMGDVYKIDQATGAVNKIGSYGTFNNKKVVSSGDLIAVRGFGIYATVNVGTEMQDYLARIDPTTWKATPIGGGTGYDNIFGLGYWKGTIYGFVSGSSSGQMITIDPATGAATEVQSGSVSWFGAGVATNAPILQ